MSQQRASLVTQEVRVHLQCRRPSSDPWVGKIPGEGSGYPLQDYRKGWVKSSEHLAMGRSLLLYPWNKMLSPYCQDLSESGIFCCCVYPQGTTSLNCSSVSSCLIWSLLENVSQCSLALSAFFQLCCNASLSPYFPSPPVVDRYCSF